jgi:hypothetical protein
VWVAKANCHANRRCRHANFQFMRDLLVLAIDLLVTLAKFLGLGGARRVVAGSLLLTQTEIPQYG